MTTTSILAELIRSQRVAWLLYRGEGVATTVVPMSLLEPFPVGPRADILGEPLEDALACVRSFLSRHPDWMGILSIPTYREDAGTRIPLGSLRRLTAEEGSEILGLGMELPLGEWADMNKSRMFVIHGGDEYA